MAGTPPMLPGRTENAEKAVTLPTSGLSDVRCLKALRPPRHLELHLVPLRQAPEAARLDGGEVDEDVFATFLSDEPVPLRVVEPLHLTLRHVSGPPCAPAVMAGIALRDWGQNNVAARSRSPRGARSAEGKRKRRAEPR